MHRLIAEELFVLVLDRETGRVRPEVELDGALGGAVLAELVVCGAVEVRPPTGRPPVPTVTAVPTVVFDDPVLVRAQQIVARTPRTPDVLVRVLAQGMEEYVGDRLRTEGVVGRRRGRDWRFIPYTAWPILDPALPTEVRRRLDRVLVRGEPPDLRTGALVAVLDGLDVVPQVVAHDGLTDGQIRYRGRQLASGSWAGRAVQDAVRAIGEAMVRGAAGIGLPPVR